MEKTGLRIGQGYDVHRLVVGRALILGGVKIPFEKGLLGHSDADVLIHSVIDAVFGAAGLGDIGCHFPDTDEKYRGANSILLLGETGKIIRNHDFSIINIDATVVAQRPKIAPFTNQMRENIARALEIDEEYVNIKGKSEEGLGFTGTGEGIAAQAVCLLQKRIR